MKNRYRKAVLSAGIMFIALAAVSQDLGKKFIVEGIYYMNFSDYKTSYKGPTTSFDYYRYINFSLSPVAGYLVTNNLAFGLELPFSYGRVKGESTDSHSTSLLIEPLIRYYIGSKKLRPYASVAIGPGWQRSAEVQFGMPETVRKNKLFKYSISAGLAYLVKDNISFDLSFGYRSLTTYKKDPMVSGIYSEWQILDRGIEGSIGVVFFL